MKGERGGKREGRRERDRERYKGAINEKIKGKNGEDTQKQRNIQARQESQCFRARTSRFHV
jgi:hypothetical protein